MRIFVPMKPMFASMSYDFSEVIEEHGGKTSFEFKFDGARIQIHRRGREIRIFSRRLSDVSESLPDVVKLVREKIGSEDYILEGEAIAIGEGEKPLPFQDLMRRFRRVHEIQDMIKRIPIRLHMFDVLYLDGKPLLDNPYSERWSHLEKICPPDLLARRMVTSRTSEAESFLKVAMEAGHEGLMAKKLDSPYSPGVRGKLWFKIKPVETLDLVIVAADWGYGRRTGWLSNYHLAAREGDEFKVLGKTFKGFTDAEFSSITNRLQSLKLKETRQTVYVHPQVVVEVAFNEIQKSPKYKSGFALRFARITRIREDKSPQDVDTIKRVRELYENQFKYKAKTNF
jgi:DNA ligase-1